MLGPSPPPAQPLPAQPAAPAGLGSGGAPAGPTATLVAYDKHGIKAWFWFRFHGPRLFVTQGRACVGTHLEHAHVHPHACLCHAYTRRWCSRRPSQRRPTPRSPRSSPQPPTRGPARPPASRCRRACMMKWLACCIAMKVAWHAMAVYSSSLQPRKAGCNGFDRAAAVTSFEAMHTPTRRQVLHYSIDCYNG
jgi:hypothetical protein